MSTDRQHDHWMTPSTASRRRCPKYNKCVAIATGSFQICCGSALFVLGIKALQVGAGASLSRPIWSICGGISVTFFLVTGIIGIVSKNQKRFLVKLYMALSILSLICAFGQLIFDTRASLLHENCTGCPEDLRVVHSLAAVVGGLEVFVALAAFANCRSGYFGPRGEDDSVVYYYTRSPDDYVTMVIPPGYAIINPLQSSRMEPPNHRRFTGQMVEPTGQPTHSPLFLPATYAIPPYHYNECAPPDSAVFT
ncbi:uncharacterized protein [Amphiura filiformis]|uniref:uncharacterized protein n=1 Tax=Amphiura filiformis TaxID=82378 RepID=UPI003B2171A5